LLGERHGLPRAYEQREAEVALQELDLPRHRRLRDVQVLGGPAEAQPPRRCEECAQVPVVHRIIISKLDVILSIILFHV
jgi:hypothetical protein